MERLTYEKSRRVWDRGKYPTKYTSRHTFQEVVAHLAAYENTDLEPEKITALQRAWDMYGGEEGITALLTAMPCYKPDGDGCAYQAYDGDDEPIDRCKECPLCCIDKQRHRSEPNDPLTLEELREMAQRCDSVYVAHTDGSPVFRNQKHCAAVLDFSPAFGSTVMHIHAIYGDRLTMWEDDYGKTWLAYRRKPGEGTP